MKIYSVIGPTAVGKTKVALKLADELLKKNNVEGIDIISADSRQVYRGLEIVSGADVPTGFKRVEKSDQKYFENSNGKIKLHGVSFIEPDQAWSVAHFIELAVSIILTADHNHRGVIVVGGTGLFHDQLRSYLHGGQSTIGIKPDEKVRTKAEGLSVDELQVWLSEVGKQKFQSMNRSDQHNPRRLIRAIEVALTQKDHNFLRSAVPSDFTFDWESVGVFPKELIAKDNLDKLQLKIEKRVRKRIENKAIDEVRELLRNPQIKSDKSQILTTLGVKEIIEHLTNNSSHEELIAIWTLHELQYSKRQLTWWKMKNN